MKRFLFLIMLVLFLTNPAHARELIEQQKIDYLITSISNLKGAVFIRNGTEYDAKKAAEHLHEKLAYAGEKISTANQFIDQCASASWLSKRKYRIRFMDGLMLDSSSYLHGKLKEYELHHPVRIN